MRHEVLHGWNVSVEKSVIQQRTENGDVPAEGWVLVFTEMLPPTGNTVRFEFGRDVRDYIVRGLTGGVVLAGGELPKI